jgi:hypothetical protein
MAIHASSAALRTFLVERTEEGTLVDAYGEPTVDDTEPYENAALSLHWVLDVAAITSGRMPWTPETIRPQLASMEAEIERRMIRRRSR